MPRVLNKRTDKIPPEAIYVGRPSKWGNPFRLNDPLLYGLPKDEKRRLVINEYRQWLEGRSDLVKEYGEPPNLSELRGKDLVCWCSPLPCHADILLELANKEPVQYKASCGHLVSEEDVVFVRQGNELIPLCISCYEAAYDACSKESCRNKELNHE